MTGPRHRLVILDRDGVINSDSPEYIKSADEWHPLSGSLDAIAALHRAGVLVVVVSNQSGIGRGLFSEASLAEIHARMCSAVEAAGGKISGIYYCPHRPEDGCQCRKPRPGLLERVARDLAIDLAGVPFVGDKWSDVEAARAAGARPMLVRTGQMGSAEDPRLANVELYPDLAAAAAQILREQD